MKKFIALVSALVCILSLCNCGWNLQKANAARPIRLFMKQLSKLVIDGRNKKDR